MPATKHNVSKFMRPCFVGIDVAFAKGKRLPVVIATWDDDVLVPANLRALPLEPPRGRGNPAALDPRARDVFASEAARYVRAACEALGWEPIRIAIDAPRAPAPRYPGRRAAELALDAARISCFTTPTADQFESVCRKAAGHLAGGGQVSRIPHANQLWMLVGFALFERLEAVAPCLEVFPQAIVRALGSGEVHKFKAGAVSAQLEAARGHTGWPMEGQGDAALRQIAWAPAHDCLDAYLSAWVAALREEDRVAYGRPPHDAIWIPIIQGRVPRVPPERTSSLTEGLPGESRSSSPSEGMLCPVCRAKVFNRWPLGWDAHAAHVCSGLVAEGPEARKREFKERCGLS